MDTNLEIEVLILLVLLISSIVALLGRRFRIPYTVGLVLAGVALAWQSDIDLQLSPRIFLSLFIPPLVFEAAFHLNFDDLKRNIRPILLLAVPGVILTTLLVGGVLSWGAGMTISTAMVFGALIAAVDPVAVIAIFRKLGVPKRLETLVEGESLLNDGTAIVIFTLVLETVRSGQFSLVDGVIDFFVVAGGGVLVGLIMGAIISRLIAQVDDSLVETTFTTVLAFGAYLVAEQFHLSGVLATVTAGVVLGNLGPRGMSPTTRIMLFNFWDYAAYLANSAVFLLIGLQADQLVLGDIWKPALWAIGAVLVSRAAAVYLLSALEGSVPTRWRHVLFWGGLRGGIALALALSLPADFGPDRTLVIQITFMVVLFSIVIQGVSMTNLLRRLGIIRVNEEQLEYQRRRARAQAAQAGIDHLRNLSRQGLISAHVWESLEPILQQRVKALANAVQEVLHDSPELESEELKTARREMLRAQRSMLSSLRRDGIIGDETFEELVGEVDLALDSGLAMWQAQMHDHGAGETDICQLLAAVIQSRDLERVSNALSTRGIPFTRIRTSGGFLRQTNHTLLIGIPSGRLDFVLDALQRSSRQRIEFLSAPFEGVPLQPAEPVERVPVEINGATVFVFDVERCEDIT
jgi:CPA1 family monovalent cation:H+ antiporter